MMSIMSALHQTTEAGDQRARHPRRVKEAIVRCQGFRCLAYLDSEGKWRNAYDDKELPEVIEVYSEM